MEKLGIRQYDVMGWSDGGISGVILAAKHPDVVRKLVIFGANPAVTKADVDMTEATRDIEKNWSKAMLGSLRPIYGDGLQAMWDGFCNAYKAFYDNGGDLCSSE